MDDAAVRVSLGLRLGLSVVTKYDCKWGARVEPLGYQGISCRLGSGRCIGFTSTEAGTAAIKASDQKTIKYATLNDSIKMFIPVCIETFGPTNGQTQTFINQLIAKVVEISGNPEAKRYIKQ
ncbi:hypothetical protein HELRODRAFT_180893 [Helobdella robusta]|uniref:Uncharacterized protein n=1 Tax=Helobdella robusta TaxID=6412 RepID=T1FGD6_HELRO|nr:hypothetical protein HELRODRAFT_180893 [Helobdella robusta]ESN93574.1 hypothetical protein HELRODRAFT_180893 [Helobdella robusta]